MFRHPWGVTEDDLTSDFFGLMKYLPADVLLVPFLELIKGLYPDRKISTQEVESAEILLWPEYEIPKKWQEQFNRPDIPAERRRSKYYIVPDVVVRSDDCVFIIEAEKSHSVEAEQLFQQYLIGRRTFLTLEKQKRRVFNLLINTDQIKPNSCRINAINQTAGIDISPADSIPQYIEKRARMVAATCDTKEIIHNFLWVSWHHIGKLIEEIVEETAKRIDKESMVALRFLSGLKDVLDEEGYYPIKLFRIEQADDLYIGDNSAIPVHHELPKLDEIIKLAKEIDPYMIPTFHQFRDTTKWLTAQSIDSIDYDVIPILRKEG